MKHWHVCEGCATPWEHDEPGRMTDKQFTDYHRCPKCKCGPYMFRHDAARALELARRLA